MTLPLLQMMSPIEMQALMRENAEKYMQKSHVSAIFPTIARDVLPPMRRVPEQTEVILQIAFVSRSIKSQFWNHRRADLLELQRLCRNPTEATRAYVALQHGTNVTVADLAVAVHAELAQRNNVMTARNA
jgi:hypothetical protein